MFKKFICIILMLTLCTSCLFTVSAQTDADVQTVNNAIALLEKLQIIYPQSELTYTSSVSRADFVLYAARSMGINDKLTDKSTRYYIDMASYDYAAYCVNSFVEKGFLSVSDDRMFRPSEPITLSEAVKIAICMAQYRPMAEARGGYPAGYISAAAKLELLDGISSGDTFTFNDAAVLLYNTLLTPVYSIDTVSEKGGSYSYEYSQSDDNTVLYESFGYNNTEGILTGYNGIDINFSVPSSDGYAIIGDKKLKVPDDMDLTDLLGNNVCALYNDDDVIYYVFAKDGDEKITEIDIDDFLSYNGLKLCYERENKTDKSVDVTSAIVLYNGAVPAENVKEIFDTLESGYIKIIDYDGNGTNDAIVINDYHSFVFKSRDSVNNIIYSKKDGQKSIDLDKYDYVTIKDGKGETVNADAFAENNILNIAISADNKRIVIIISTDNANGSVTKISRENDIVLTVDDRDYTVNNAASADAKNVNVGDKITALLNMYGKIVYIINDGSENYKAGFMCGLDTASGAFDDSVQIRLYTKDEGLKTYTVADTVKIDGIKRKGIKEIAKAIPDCSYDGAVSYTSQIILYKLNADGEISGIDTYFVSSAENPDTTLCRTTDGGESLSKYGGRLGRKNPIDSTTDIFVVPSEKEIPGSTKDDYSVVQQNRFNSNVTMSSVECYKTKGNDEICSTVVYRNVLSDFEANDWLNTNIFVVGDIFEAVDDDDEKYISLSGLYQGSTRMLSVYENNLVEKSAKFTDLDEGDLIRYRTGKNGKIIELQKLYDASENKRISWSGDTETESLFDTSFSNNFQLSFGYVNSRGNKVVTWGYKSGANVDEALDLSSATVMYYDKNQKSGKRLYTGKIGSITDYQTAGDGCDIIIIQMNQTSLKHVVVYKR